MLSIIIPTFHEEKIIAHTVRHLFDVCGDVLREVIVVDSSETMDTGRLASHAGATVYHTTTSSRGAQMNIGATVALSDTFLFLHADTRLVGDISKDFKAFHANTQYVYGAFLKEFDSRHLFLRLMAQGNNFITRYRWSILGDNGLLIRRDFFDACGGFPEYVLMEDVAMSVRMKCIVQQQHKGFFLFTQKLVTSARRFEAHGVYRTFFLMQYLRLRYALGTSPEKLKKHYH